MITNTQYVEHTELPRKPSENEVDMAFAFVQRKRTLTHLNKSQILTCEHSGHQRREHEKEHTEEEAARVVECLGWLVAYA